MRFIVIHFVDWVDETALILMKLQLTRENNATVLAVPTRNAHPKLIREIVDGKQENLFNISLSSDAKQFAQQIAQRIHAISEGAH